MSRLNVEDLTLEQLNAISKDVNARKRELKNVGSVERQAILRGMVAKDGFEALKVDWAVIRKEQKKLAKAKAEAELEGLEEEGEKIEEAA